MPVNRRNFIRQSVLLSGVAGLNMPLPFSQQENLNADGDRLVLLGTQGGPFIRSYKQTPASNLIVYKGTSYVVDTGYGVTFKLLEAGIRLASLKNIFITHHHSDHNLELGPLLYNAWLAGLAQPVDVYAPPGLTAMLDAYLLSNRFDLETRIKDEKRPDLRPLIKGHEYKEGIIVSKDDVEVSALTNIHPPVNGSFALKFKLGNKIIVFSGDTAYLPALAKFAGGADYLIHEVMNAAGVEEMIKRRPNAPGLKESILSHHTSAEDAGRIAQSANVKNLVLNHFVPPDDKTLTDEVWTNAARSTFKGNIVIAKDMMEFAL